MAARYCYGRNISSEEIFGILRSQPLGSRATGQPPGLREQALLAPLIAVAGKQHAVVQPKRPFLPELDPCRLEPKAGPVRRPWHRALLGKLPGVRRETALQHLAVGQRLGLVGGPGADLAVARPAREIGLRLLLGNRHDSALDPDLPRQRLPVEAQRRPRVGVELVRFAALQVGVEDKAAG